MMLLCPSLSGANLCVITMTVANVLHFYCCRAKRDDAARLAGYTDMAVWLENIVLLLDTDGEFKPLRDIPEVVEEAGWEHGENSLYR